MVFVLGRNLIVRDLPNCRPRNDQRQDLLLQVVMIMMIAAATSTPPTMSNSCQMAGIIVGYREEITSVGGIKEEMGVRM